MRSTFAQALKWDLIDEGPNSDDPDDHGGRTSRGITQREYTAWRQERGLSDQDVYLMPDDECTEIYLDEYWDPQCDNLPIGIDYLFFDESVNAGPHAAAVILQRALGVADDGRIGPITRQAIAKADSKQLCIDFTVQREAYYRSLHQFKFLKGWINRSERAEQRALGLVNGTVQK